MLAHRLTRIISDRPLQVTTMSKDVSIAAIAPNGRREVLAKWQQGATIAARLCTSIEYFGGRNKFDKFLVGGEAFQLFSQLFHGLHWMHRIERTS